MRVAAGDNANATNHANANAEAGASSSDLKEEDGAKTGSEAEKESCTLPSAGKDPSDTQVGKMVVEPKCGSETPCHQRASEKTAASAGERGVTETV